jgi:hypothetical protein
MQLVELVRVRIKKVKGGTIAPPHQAGDRVIMKYTHQPINTVLDKSSLNITPVTIICPFMHSIR